MLDLKKCVEARREIKDIDVDGKMMSFEQIERKAKQRADKRAKLLKEARKVLSREQMVVYIEQGKVDKSWGIKLSKLPKEV